MISANEESVRLRAWLFDTETRTVPVRLWRLKPGRYKWSTNSRSGAFTVSALPFTLELPLEARTDTAITIRAEP